MTGIAISTCPSGRPPSLDTFPVMVTGSWAGALDTTSMPGAAAANTLRTMRRMMDPPGRRGTGGLRVSRHATQRFQGPLQQSDGPRRRRAVVQDHHILPAEERLELLDLLEVHDGRPVDPDEAGRVELTLEVLHRLAQQVPGLTDVDAHVVPLRVYPVDFAHGQERHLSARLDEQSIEVPRASGPRRLPGAEERRQLLGQLPQTAVAHLLLRALQRLSEALVGERLEEIVDGVHIEGAQRVLIEGRHEHDGGCPLPPPLPQEPLPLPVRPLELAGTPNRPSPSDCPRRGPPRCATRRDA